MSVRKAASRANSRDLSGGAQALKSLGFWALLAGASFVVGLFILSPLINVAAGSRSSAEKPAPTVSAPQPSPQPAVSVAAPAPRTERPADSDVGISVEKPKPAENPEVQAPLTVDDSARSRTDETTTAPDDRRSRRHRDSEEDRSGSRDSGPAERSGEENAARPGRGEITVDPQPTDTLDRSTRSERANRDRSSEPSDESTSRRRRGTRRSRSDEESTPTHDRTAPPPDVQKGDSIDR